MQVFRCVVFLRDFLYRNGVFLSEECGAQVVSIGNLSAGGTGKTPITAALCRKVIQSIEASQGENEGLARDGRVRIGIVSRGYGRKSRGSLRVALGVGAAETFGDEPVWLAETLKVPVQVGESKVRAAQDLVASEGLRLIVVDDGFQHRALQRHFDIVLIDASTPSWKRELLPLGYFREPMSALLRADAVFLTKTESVSEEVIQELETLVRAHLRSNTPVIRWIQELEMAGPREATAVAGASVVLLAGIANPRGFFDMIKSRFPSLKVIGTRSFSDHQVYTTKMVARTIDFAREIGAEFVIATEKDCTKLRELWSSSGPSLLSTKLSVRTAREIDERNLEALIHRITSKIASKVSKRGGT